MKLHLPYHLRAVLLSSLLAAVGLTLNSGSDCSSVSFPGRDDTVSLTIRSHQESGSPTHRTMVLENSLAGSLTSGSSSVVRTNSAGIIPVTDSSSQTVSPAAAAELVTTASPSPQQQSLTTTATSTPQIAEFSFPTPVYPAPLALSGAEISTTGYTPPTTISIPAGYTKVLVDEVSDIEAYSSSATDVAFRITQDLTIVGRSSSLMTTPEGSWYFTSNTVNKLASLNFNEATTTLFHVAEAEKLEFNGLKNVEFIGNTAKYATPYSSTHGGVIWGLGNNTITLCGNENVTFRGNTVKVSASDPSSFHTYYACGGAIYVYAYGNSTITLSGNESVAFIENTASSSSVSNGGAIYVAGYDSAITLNDNGSVVYNGNAANLFGGAIYTKSAALTLMKNGSVGFCGNSAESGGAIYGSYNTTVLSGNKNVVFDDNKATNDGGAICYSGMSTITLSSNESVTFSENSVVANFPSNVRDSACGGAICVNGFESSITLNDNGNVTFSGNTIMSSSSAYGGAIYVRYEDSTITLSGNESVTFSGNTASASSSDDAYAYGGAIYGYGNLNIRNNDSVLFEKNAEVQNETYRLRSIYAGGSGDVISLSAAEGKSIEFRDSVYIASGSTVNLNADYTDADGLVHKQTGNIIFTGAYTEQHLNELLAADGLSRTATAEEILNSRTTVVDAMTNLYGGRLRVEDGAIYQGYGITAHEGSTATVLVKDATLNHAGYDLAFCSGTILELVGDNVISGNVGMQEGSTLIIDAGNLSQEFSPRITGGVFRVSGNVKVIASVDLRQLDSNSHEYIIGDGTYSWNPESVEAFFSVTWCDEVLGVNEKLSANSLGALVIDVRSTEAVTWDNAAGDGLWNNRSANWVDGDYRFTYVQGTNVTFGEAGEGVVTLDGDISIGSMLVEGDSEYVMQLTDGSSLRMEGVFSIGEGASLRLGTGIDVSSLVNQGNLIIDGKLSVAGDVVGEGELSVESLTAESLSAASLRLTDTDASNTVKEAVSVSGAVDVAGSLSAGGSLSGTAVTVGGALSAASLTADSLSAASLELTAADAANSVSGDLTADAVSLASGASLEVGGTLTAAEVLIHGSAKVLQAGAFGAETMNFVLDRAALESLNLSGGDTGTIARANTAMGSGFTATLNGGMMPVQAAAYVYDISVNGGAVQLTADYVHDGMQVWSSGKWVGQSGWTDYYIAGYDAVNGVETVNLSGKTVQGDNLFIAYEDDVRSSVVKNGTLEFAYVDMGGGQFELGEGAEMTTDELYGKGETLVMHQGSVLNATELTLGTLALEGGELTVKKATINAMSGTEGTLNIESRGQVTVKSDVTLTGLENLGTLKLGTNNLTVNALVDVGGNVTAGEVAVQSRGSRMASFDKLVVDKVTVVNNISTGRYTDDLSVGDGSAIGELVAETLEVREGVVTLGRTDRATEQVLLNLDLQEDAALVLNQQTALRVTEELTATEGAEVRLKKQASVSYGDLSIGNRGAATQVVVNAAELADGELSELSNAHVALSGSEDRSIDYKLTNSSVENTGSGKLTVTHEENTLSGVYAATGDIAVMNQAMGLNLNELVVGEGVSFSAYRGETEAPELEAVVSVSQTVTFGAGAHINADLKLQRGVKVEMNGPVSMGSDLYLFTGMTLGGAMLESLTSAEQGQTVVLFSGIDTLYLDGDAQNAALTLAHGVNASDYFTNLVSTTERGYYLTYDNATPGEGVLSVTIVGMAAVPEPTTATLSLLALAALAARRRRASL